MLVVIINAKHSKKYLKNNSKHILLKMRIMNWLMLMA